METIVRCFVTLVGFAWLSAAFNEFVMPDRWIMYWWGFPACVTWIGLSIGAMYFSVAGPWQPIASVKNCLILFSRNHWNGWVLVSSLGSVGALLGCVNLSQEREHTSLMSLMILVTLTLAVIAVFGIYKWAITHNLLNRIDQIVE